MTSDSDQPSIDLAAVDAERERIRATYLEPEESRADLHGSRAAPLRDRLLGTSRRPCASTRASWAFPLTDIFENRDFQGSNHFFFDIGNDNLLAFFDFPGLDVGPYAEVLGGLHHVAISVEPEKWAMLRDRLDEAGVEYQSAERRVDLLPGSQRRAGWSSSPTRWGRCTARRCCDQNGSCLK